MIAALLLGTLAVAGLALGLDLPEIERVADPVDDNDNAEPDSNAPLPEVMPTAGSDILLLGDDDNDVSAGGGADTVIAGAGDDSVSGGAGQDLLFGGDGEDSLIGGDYHDILFGEEGEDLLHGDAGKDALFGGDGDDTLVGGDWHDALVGGDGADSLSGGNGNDELIGVNLSRDLTVDEIRHLRDQDDPQPIEDLKVSARADGADTLDGGADDDVLMLGKGDTGSGGEGNDSFDLYLDQDGAEIITVEDYDPAEDMVQVILDRDPILINPEDFSVAVDEDTGDALILERGVVVSRLLGAGDSFTIEDLILVSAA